MNGMNPSQANSPKCDIGVYQRDSQTLLVLDGSLVLQNSEKVRARVHPLLETSSQNVDIFIGKLGFIDSSGLGVLVGFQVMAKKNKVNLRILAPTPTHMHLFEATRLNSVFRIVDSAAAAPILADMAMPELEVK